MPKTKNRFVELSGDMNSLDYKLTLEELKLTQNTFETYEVIYKSEETNWQRKSTWFSAKGKSCHKAIENYYQRKYPKRQIIDVRYW